MFDFEEISKTDSKGVFIKSVDSQGIFFPFATHFENLKFCDKFDDTLKTFKPGI